MIMEQAQINIFTHTAVCADLQHEALAERPASFSTLNTEHASNKLSVRFSPSCQTIYDSSHI